MTSRYGELLKVRFPGWSQGWVEVVTEGAALPSQPGLVWCDAQATRLFAWRRSRRAR